MPSRRRATAAPTRIRAAGPRPRTISCIANIQTRRGPGRPPTGSRTKSHIKQGKMQQNEFTNHLIHETSPYLLQHAHNPVDWYPWGEEAFAKARAENKPVLLSIGYSACHWCHVMAHESFEDEEIARLMNENFVPIKVDREERPDLDQIYMNAVQMLTGHGGWPMSVFLTPDLKPFYGGTYWPPHASRGMPGFDQILAAVADAWNHRREYAIQGADQLTAELQNVGVAETGGDASALKADLITNAAAQLGRSFDHAYGGFGQAPKFPH